jgi:hypothetical protein
VHFPSVHLPIWSSTSLWPHLQPKPSERPRSPACKVDILKGCDSSVPQNWIKGRKAGDSWKLGVPQLCLCLTLVLIVPKFCGDPNDGAESSANLCITISYKVEIPPIKTVGLYSCTPWILRIVITIINHSYWSYLHQLSNRLGALRSLWVAPIGYSLHWNMVVLILWLVMVTLWIGDA